MIDPLLIFIAAVFTLAGFVKGVIGLGLPSVAIGLLATRMPPAQAVAIVIVPAIVTNIWQSFAGPYLRDILKRLWPLLAFTCIGVWLGRDLMTGAYAGYGTILLGVLLVLYSVLGLSRARFAVARRHELWLGAPLGLVNGVLSAATGVQVIPAMPFMQAMGMEKDELVQALGLFFTVATLALAANLTSVGLLNIAVAVPGGVALGMAFVGMFAGQALRARMDADAFRRYFLLGMILLGAYLALDSLARLH